MGKRNKLMVAMSTVKKQSEMKLQSRQTFDIEAKQTLLIP
jgi:hypothetical protein